MSDTFDRSQLDGKDREQLAEIATALGVKAISRMRKADLVDAIVSAAGNGSASASAAPTTEKPRRIRSTKPAVDDLAALAAEEDSLETTGGSNGSDDMARSRPRRRGASGNGNSGANGASTDTGATDTAADAAASNGHGESASGRSAPTSESDNGDTNGAARTDNQPQNR